MIDDILIFDDIIDKKYQLEIIDKVLGKEFDWYFQKDVSISNNDIQQRVNMLTCLNRIIRAKKSVDFEIGHSYFMDNDTLVNILNKQVLPLLNEYFMYDLKKVKEIIEKTQKDKEGEAIPKTGIIFNNQIWKDRGLLEVESIKSAEDNLDVVETDETTQD